MSASQTAELFSANPSSTEEQVARQIKHELENNDAFDCDRPTKRYRVTIVVEEIP